MGQHESSLDTRIHAFNDGKSSHDISDKIANWLHDKFGGRPSEVQASEPTIGMKYETASRGKL